MQVQRNFYVLLQVIDDFNDDYFKRITKTVENLGFYFTSSILIWIRFQWSWFWWVVSTFPSMLFIVPISIVPLWCVRGFLVVGLELIVDALCSILGDVTPSRCSTSIQWNPHCPPSSLYIIHRPLVLTWPRFFSLYHFKVTSLFLSLLIQTSILFLQTL